MVPGVTAASGISAYAGIPLTHRDHAQAVVFATGYLKDGSIELDWPMLARPRQTVVIYMGVTRPATSATNSSPMGCRRRRPPR